MSSRTPCMCKEPGSPHPRAFVSVPKGVLKGCDSPVAMFPKTSRYLPEPEPSPSFRKVEPKQVPVVGSSSDEELLQSARSPWSQLEDTIELARRRMGILESRASQKESDRVRRWGPECEPSPSMPKVTVLEVPIVAQVLPKAKARVTRPAMSPLPASPSGYRYRSSDRSVSPVATSPHRDRQGTSHGSQATAEPAHAEHSPSSRSVSPVDYLSPQRSPASTDIEPRSRSMSPMSISPSRRLAARELEPELLLPIVFCGDPAAQRHQIDASEGTRVELRAASPKRRSRPTQNSWRGSSRLSQDAKSESLSRSPSTDDFEGCDCLSTTKISPLSPSQLRTQRDSEAPFRCLFGIATNTSSGKSSEVSSGVQSHRAGGPSAAVEMPAFLER